MTFKPLLPIDDRKKDENFKIIHHTFTDEDIEKLSSEYTQIHSEKSGKTLRTFLRNKNFIKEEMDVVEAKFQEKHEEKTRKQINPYLIFDEREIYRTEIFQFCQLNEHIYAFGVFIPKWTEEKDKKGNTIRKVQRNSPVLISEGEIHELNYDQLEKHKIKFKTIPAPFKLRWSLNSILKTIKGESPEIDGVVLFEKIRKKYIQYLYFHNENWYSVRALWDIGTYVFPLFEYFPLAELRGHSGTAKNKIMAVSRQISFNASEEMTNPSEATLFRGTHEFRWTKYIDEAENLFQHTKKGIEPDDRAQLINAGYKYTGTVPRQEKIDGKYQTFFYDAFSPTMIASINGLFGATEDRALIQITTKAPKNDKRGSMEPNPKDTVWQEIRDELYIFALQNAPQIKETYEKIEITGLIEREFFLWKPLLAIAKILDEKLYLDVLDFAKEQQKLKGMNRLSEGSYEYKIAEIIFECIKKDGEKVLFKDIQTMWGERYGSDHVPHTKTISAQADKLGLIDYKDHWEGGNGYRLTPELFETIISPLIPSLFSSSPSSPSVCRDKKEQTSLKQNEEFLKQTEGKEEQQNEAGNVNFASGISPIQVFPSIRKPEANEAERKEGSILAPTTKDALYSKIKDSGSEGISTSILTDSSRDELVKCFLRELENEGKIYFENGRHFAKEKPANNAAGAEGS